MNMTHGYGGVFNYKTANDKAIVEICTAREWAQSVAAEFNLKVGEPQHNPDDPPDCFISVEGRRLAVELVQLVEFEHKQRAAKNETPFAGKLFEDMQWSKERLIFKLDETVRIKSHKYDRVEKSVDVLLIHSAEPWLNSSQVRRWLVDAQLDQYPNIESVFLLLDYEPGQDVQHWPVFRLYGDLRGGIK